ncbi:PR domain zinc finger protein 2 isoform X2 [Epinephelus moara]|uniref:PR domain zinc finger protein 2 isoform X2 n=1 Tax=Epinephelus moara TaxID=300413 RepID=UPI00214F00A2|nr:PR domain zinc finger protein 2 isoform X2 [Epinephelus moara]
MDNSPHLYISEFGDNEDMEEDEEDIHQEETNMESDMIQSPDLHKHPNQDTERDWNSFPCPHCERRFTSKQGLERHMHIHTLVNNDAPTYKSNKSNTSFGSNLDQLQHEKMKPLDSGGSVTQLHTSSPAGSNTSVLSAGDHSAQPDKSRVLEGHNACKYCEKIFTTHTNKRRHERRVHEQQLQVTHVEKTPLPQEEYLQRVVIETSQQETDFGDNTAPAAVVENEAEPAEQYMLDVSSNISENLSFYIDGKIVSTSTVSSCEAAEVHSGSSTLVGLDALILDPAQISQVLNTDSVSGKELPGQPQAKRRTATPPLLPQIKTELESEVVVSSSSSSLVSSLIENLLPQNTESTVVQKERTVFLSPKLKQLLEKQDGLKPTLALIADGQKPCSPVSLSVLPAGTGRFKRRTGSPPSSPQQNPTEDTPDAGECDAVTTGQMETQHSSPVQQTASMEDDTPPPVEEPEAKPILTESWPPTTGESVTLSTATTSVISDCPPVGDSSPDPEPVVHANPPPIKEEEAVDSAVSIPEISSKTPPPSEKAEEDETSNNTPSDAQQQTFTKNFICNVCDKLFHSMKELGHHVGDHADEWPYKCEFCLLLFSKTSALLDHRSNLHGVGKTYVCSACTKEFVYLCNLKQHQEELHPGQQCTYTEEEKGKLRPQNYNNTTKVNTEPSVPDAVEEPKKLVKKEEGEEDVAAEELFTTIKIMASDGAKMKGPDVRLGINQHYPSFKPPPFPYHNRSPAGSLASATNFTTHNIPQTFSTAIRCTKCGKSFDNMPELHKHILACANASDKRRYTPKKNPIPLRHFAKTQNGVLSTTNSTNGLNASNRSSHSNRSKANHDPAVNVKFKVLNKRKKKLVQRVMPQRNKSNKMSPAQVDEQQEIFVCPHCSREFTMRRSRTKHMAVCPKKPKEVKKRKEGGISVTKENDGHLHRGVEEKQASPPHKTRLQTSGPAKRPAVLPVQTVFSNKRSKIIIKESTQPKQETPTLNELPIVRTFNPSMRQYSRMQHSVKGIPIKITIVKPQQAAPPRDELPPTQSREDTTAAVTSSSEQSPTA